jgi:hypothetical protein
MQFSKFCCLVQKRSLEDPEAGERDKKDKRGK